MGIKKAYYQIKHVLDSTRYKEDDDFTFGARLAYVIALDIIKTQCPEVLDDYENRYRVKIDFDRDKAKEVVSDEDMERIKKLFECVTINITREGSDVPSIYNQSFSWEYKE